MKQFRWKNYTFIILIMASFACKTLLPAEPMSSQNSPEATSTIAQTPEGDGVPPAPTTNWLMFFDSNYRQQEITNDSKGNIYIFEYKDASDDSIMLYLSKITNSGNKEWQTPLAETSYGSNSSITTDLSGNVYVASSGTKTWGDPIIPFVGSGDGGYDVFVTKIDQNGNILWNTFTGERYSSTISVDQQGNLYVMTFDKFDTAKKNNFSLIKLDTNGNILFDIPISGLDNAEPYYLVAGPNGSIYISGGYHGNHLDLFLAKLTSDGSLEWMINIGGSETADYITHTNGQKIQVDKNGNAYIFGVSTANWGNPINPYDGGFSADDYQDYVGANGNEYFIAKINSNGELVWHTFLNKTVHLFGAALDTNGNLFISGFSYGDWGNPIKAYNPENNNDGFIALIDVNTGTVVWNLFIGEDGEDAFSDMTIMDNNIYILGGTDKPFGNILNQNSNNGGGFLARISLP